MNPREFGLPEGFRWRPKQVEVIKAALKAFRYGFRNVLIDCPTGLGKTVMNYCVAKRFRNAIYTTPQIALLDQIERDPLLDIAVVKGRDNYPCVVERGKTAANGRCVRDRRFKCYEDCPYKIAKARALAHPIAAMSFAYLIVDRFLPDEYSFGNRELIIVDEADDLEGWAEEFGSFRFRVEQEFKDIDDVVVWAKAVLKNTRKRIDELESYPELTDEKVKELDKLRKYEMKMIVFLNKVTEKPNNWVFEKQDGYLVVKPVNVGDILNELVWSRGKYRIASSGTIIDKEMFCKTTGLNPKETFIIKVGSIFPVERRPVYYYPVAKMTKEERVNGYDKLVDVVGEIVRRFRYRTIIHAHSYEIAREIAKRISVDGVRVAVHDEKNRKRVFRRFIEGEIDVLISVGFNRGVDLKDDLCRVNVILKVPFPDVSDIRVRELWVKRKSWNWARYQAIKNLVQAYGRTTRSEDDWSITFILDESFSHLFRYKSQFPSWFIEAVREISSLEEVKLDGDLGV